MENKALIGKNIWITGASSGIGKAIAVGLINSGANLILSASAEKSFIDLKKEISSEKLEHILFLPFDIAKVSNIKNAYKIIEEKFGHIDILVNNAGLAIFKRLLVLSEEEFDLTLNVNLKGAYFMCQAVLPAMIQRKSGMIINLSSVAAIKSYTNSTAYSASKAGMLLMSRCLRDEVRNDGIKVIDVLPGATHTDIWSKEAIEKYSERMMSPENIAKIIINAIESSIGNNAVIEEIIIRPISGDL